MPTKWEKEKGFVTKDVFEWPLTFRYRGEFDYDGIIQLIRDYYAKVKIENLKEPTYKYKVGASGGAEVVFKLTGEVKVSAYTKLFLNVQGHMWEVVRGKPTNGRLEIKIQTQYLYDYGKGFNSDNMVHRWMKERIHQPNQGKGVAYGDLKAEGKKTAEKMGNNLLAEIKTFIGVECV